MIMPVLYQSDINVRIYVNAISNLENNQTDIQQYEPFLVRMRLINCFECQ